MPFHSKSSPKNFFELAPRIEGCYYFSLITSDFFSFRFKTARYGYGLWTDFQGVDSVQLFAESDFHFALAEPDERQGYFLSKFHGIEWQKHESWKQQWPYGYEIWDWLWSKGILFEGKGLYNYFRIGERYPVREYKFPNGNTFVGAITFLDWKEWRGIK